MHRLWVLIPTYNEAEALPRLIPQLMPRLRKLELVDELHVLIIDDGSPDGTGEVAERLAREHTEIDIMHRAEKNGLAEAYTAGMRHAIENRASKIIQMDVDGSHRPEDVPALWRAALEQPVVIGSRYCHGGRIEGWHWARRIISKMVSWYGRTLLRLPVGDPNAGFRIWDAGVLNHLIPFSKTRGFVFLAELTLYARLAGVTPVEVPVVFVEREVGTSKADFWIAVEELWRVAQMCVRPPHIPPYNAAPQP